MEDVCCGPAACASVVPLTDGTNCAGAATSSELQLLPEYIPVAARHASEVCQHRMGSSYRYVTKRFTCLNTLVCSFRTADDSRGGEHATVQLVFQSIDQQQKHSQHIRVDIHEKRDTVYEEASKVADIHAPVFGIHLDQGELDDSVEMIFDIPAGDHDVGSLCFIKKPESTSAASKSGDEGDWEIIEGQFECLEGGRRIRGCVVTRTFSCWTIACCKVRVATHCIQSGNDMRVDTIIVTNTGHVPIPRADYSQVQELSKKKQLLKECKAGFSLHHRPVSVKQGDMFEMVLVKYLDKGYELAKTEASRWEHTTNSLPPDPLLVPKHVGPEELLATVLRRNGKDQKIVVDTYIKLTESALQTSSFKYFPDYVGSSDVRYSECNAVGCGKTFHLWAFKSGRRHCHFCGSVFCRSHCREYNEVCYGVKASLCMHCADLLSLDAGSAVEEPCGGSSDQAAEAPPLDSAAQSDLPALLGSPPTLTAGESRYSGVVVFTSSLATCDRVNEESRVICNIMAPQHTPVFTDVDRFNFALNMNRKEIDRKQILHFGGHGREGKSFLFQPTQSEGAPQAFSDENLASILNDHKTVECVFLNACATLDLGKKILELTSVTYVLCWSEDVPVHHAVDFADKFYRYLKSYPNAYGLAFCTACVTMETEDASMAGKPCILYKDGSHIHSGIDLPPLDDDMVRKYGEGPRHMCWSDGHMVSLRFSPKLASDTVEDDEVSKSPSRSWAPIGKFFHCDSNMIRDTNASTHYSAKAGQMERNCLEALGIVMKYKGKTIGEYNSLWKEGPSEWNGLDCHGRLHKQVLRGLMHKNPKVHHYTDLWGEHGFVLELAETCTAEQVEEAIECLQQVVHHRADDMAHHSKKVPKHFLENRAFCRYV
jgi:hypothetical protein